MINCKERIVKLNNSNKILWIESLRGIACLIVLFAHLLNFNSEIGTFANGCGKIAVWFFFIISGLFVVYNFNVDKLELNYVKKFYIKKIGRLYPTYIIGLIMAWGVGYIYDYKSFFRHILTVEGNKHFWYMAVILRFTLLIPFIQAIYIKIRSKKVFLLLVCGVAILFSVMFPWFIYEENSIDLKWYVPVFCMGIIMAYIFKYTEEIKLGLLGDFIAIAASVSIFLMTPVSRYLLWGRVPTDYLQNKYIIVGVLWCLILFGVARGRHIIKILDKAWMLHLVGKYSYAVYIFHVLIYCYFEENGLSWGWNCLLTIVLSFVISILLEKLYLIIKDKINISK